MTGGGVDIWFHAWRPIDVVFVGALRKRHGAGVDDGVEIVAQGGVAVGIAATEIDCDVS